MCVCERFLGNTVGLCHGGGSDGVDDSFFGVIDGFWFIVFWDY